jgi:outer membrane lipoprotein-sorting protein
MRRSAWIGVAVVGSMAYGTGALMAQQDEGRGLALLEEASARYANVTALCADFVQTLSVPLLGEEKTGRGTLCQRQPDRFAMRFDDPAGDAVVVDGTWVWIYYPSLDAKQVIRVPMAGGSGAYDFHREFLHDPAEKYTVVYLADERVDSHDAYRLRLVPRAPASYVAAELWIDREAHLLRRIRIEDENGTVRTVTLDAIDLAPTGLDDDWFTFTPPPGAQVITGRL